MALLSAYDVVTADSAVTVAALAELGILLVQRNALTCFCAVGVDSEADGVGRSRLCLDSLNSLVDVLNQLVDATDDDNAFGAVKNRSNAVGVAVDVVEFAVFGDSVGACEERVGAEGLAVNLLNLLAGNALARTVEVVVISRTDNIINSRLLECDGTAV